MIKLYQTQNITEKLGEQNVFAPKGCRTEKEGLCSLDGLFTLLHTDIRCRRRGSKAKIIHPREMIIRPKSSTFHEGVLFRDIEDDMEVLDGKNSSLKEVIYDPVRW